jgi:phage terminase large subunit-like protein
MVRVVVAIDPAATSNEDSDETGIVVVGKGIDGRGYVLADRTCKLSPAGWAQRAIDAFDEFQASRIVGETNMGGEMIETIIKQLRPTIPYRGVVAKRGKRLRAEPISALYEQGRVSHQGYFPQLEEQMTTWVDGESDFSPDRLDALVHGLTALDIGTGSSAAQWFASVAPNCLDCGMPNELGSTTCASCGQPLQ